MTALKLNYKKTIKVGLAFATIMLFWTVYDFVVPLLLDNVYGLPDDIRGLVMGLDNLLSLVLLPFFGNLSDKSKSKRGRRTPYIVVGTLLSVALMIFVPVAASSQQKEAQELRAQIESSIDDALLSGFYDDAAAGKNAKYCDVAYLAKSNISRDEYISLRYIEVEEVKDGGNTKYIVSDTETEISEAEYNEILDMNKKYDTYVKSGVNVYISDTIYDQITKKDLGSLIVYMVILLFVLISMAVFRSPAVALMPDVTPKPLRSQANAFISLAGGVGGAIGFVIYTAWLMIAKNPFIQIFATAAFGMLLLLFLFLKMVNEPKLIEECREICKEHNITDQDDPEFVDGGGKMGRAKKISFLLILASIFMWFMGYNAVTSNMSIYATRNLLFAPSMAGIINAISMGISAIAFIPVGYLAAKIGRKKTIIIGFILATASFALTYLFVRQDATRWLFPVFYMIAGFGLIIANVNTFPMVVELSAESSVGKYTGYYYTATMSAQAITPYIAGIFMKIEAKNLFLYSAVMVAIAVVFMAFVKHGDAKKIEE